MATKSEMPQIKVGPYTIQGIDIASFEFEAFPLSRSVGNHEPVCQLYQATDMRVKVTLWDRTIVDGEFHGARWEDA